VKVLIAGATGHFGGLIAGHLVAQGRGGELVVTSRTLARAQRLAFACTVACALASAESAVKIGGRVLDAASPESCRRAVDGCALCIDCAGPFQSRDGTLVQACADAGCDYLDLSDDAGYTARMAEAAASARIRVFTAHSTFAATVLFLVHHLVAPQGMPRQVRVGLVMATRGGAGRAAMRALLTTLDRIRAAREGFALTFPDPIGRRELWLYPTPNERWLREILEVPECASAIGFSNRAIAPVLMLLSRLGLRLSAVAGALRLGRALMDAWPPSRGLGCLQISARWEEREETVSLLARGAATAVPCFPAILTGLAYLRGTLPSTPSGLHWLHEWLPWSEWEQICRNGGAEMHLTASTERGTARR